VISFYSCPVSINCKKTLLNTVQEKGIEEDRFKKESRKILRTLADFPASGVEQ